jgi:hypothetical protein
MKKGFDFWLLWVGWLLSGVLLMVLLSGCNTPRKVKYNTSDSIQINSERNEKVVLESYASVDTTKKQDVEINYFKIEFYPPAQDDKPATIPAKDTIPEALSGNIVGDLEKLTNNTGAIKSLEGYTVKAKSEQSGVTAEANIAEAYASDNTNVGVTSSESLSEQPAPDPYRWRYILGIIILAGAGAYFIFRKSKFIFVIISFLKRIWKKVCFL